MKQDGWATRTGLILAVASSAIGLGNFLRFPGQVAQNGGGAFMLPYIISFLLLGIPVCISEWILGREGGRTGHSYPMIMRRYLKGEPLYHMGTLGLMVPILIYVYYVFVESWCLAYAWMFLTGKMNFVSQTPTDNTASETQTVIQSSGDYFLELTGAKAIGASFESPILIFLGIVFLLNYALVFRGLAKGLEAFSKLAIPLMILFSSIILVRVLTLDNIELGLGKMWNPDWSSLSESNVWLSAAGQIFFSLSTGFGIALVFSSFLSEKDDVALSSLSSASLNEFSEIIFGGMITIPIAFLFLGSAVTSFGTFGMGFIALPAVFSLMPSGEIFGALWFFVLFLAALTSSVTMLQPGIIFLEEALHMDKRRACSYLGVFTLALTLPIVYFNIDFTAMDIADFYVGTLLIYVLATLQILVFVFQLGTEKGISLGQKGSLIHLPHIFHYILKYITPTLLVIIFVSFLWQNVPEYIDKLNPDISESLALAKGETGSVARSKSYIGQFVLLAIASIYTAFYFLVKSRLRQFEGKK